MAATAMVAGTLLFSSGTTASPVTFATLPKCTELKPPSIEGVRILSTVATPYTDHVYTDPSSGTVSPPLSYCEVNVTLTHDGTDTVLVTTWLPLHPDAWNGRFQGTGGGGWIAGKFGTVLAPAVQRGYAAASTDAGVGFDEDGKFLLVPPAHDKIDRTLLENFGHRSIHEMTLIGKALTRDYYGRKPRSYFTGCSTGGRQAYMEAQRYPDDYEGVMGNAPALDWAAFLPAATAPDNLRNQLGYKGPVCELVEVRRRAVEACDALDGLVDGIVSAFDQCHFDARSVVGASFHCTDTGADMRISDQAAQIANLVWSGVRLDDGTRLWWGLNHDANLTVASGQDDTYSIIGDQWIYAVERNLTFDVHALRPPQLAAVQRKSIDEFDDVIGTFDPDLSRFRQRGGKLLTYTGLADLAVSPNLTLSYYRAVEEHQGGRGGKGAAGLDDFYRVFLAQGVEHCVGGLGPLPDDPLSALVDWVEKGRAPDRLPATTQDSRKLQQPLCKWPKLPRYDAQGQVECRDDGFADRFRGLDGR
ncbi:uncharacterized protein PFL1_06154 [Pseudozyma flocculosa PF-1]|uniref:Carboxylic ester hydrolase n=2 Tax=Pseudozyma flocculosa TaxID=84751 RepID=A0A5C3F965_9BASI|nr:uncharacterized protein PFL1_06154 [Pseudozyma flocculosa PF-1]EPQ26219.1 hypothetical protein PFL1_06154 [Pseudozyma flocculosa PF-1]SPO40175.1 related to tannase precursor [Pseudozyma flocculosa]